MSGMISFLPHRTTVSFPHNAQILTMCIAEMMDSKQENKHASLMLTWDVYFQPNIL